MGYYQTIKKSLQSTLLHQKERQKTLTSIGLSTSQPVDHMKCIPPSPQTQTHQPTKQVLPLHQIQHMIGIQQCKNQRRRQMEGSFRHQWRPVQTDSNVLRINQLPSHLPDNDEIHIHQRYRRKWLKVYMDDMAIHTKHQPEETEESHILWHQSYIKHILDKLMRHNLFLKPEKMCLQTTLHRIPRHMSNAGRSTNERHESGKSVQLANPKEHHRNPQIPRVHRILPLLY